MFKLRSSKCVFSLLIICCTLISFSDGIGFGFVARAFSGEAIRNSLPKFRFNVPKVSPEEIPLSWFPKSKFSGPVFPPPPRPFPAEVVPKYSGPSVYQLPPLNFDLLYTKPKLLGAGVDRSAILPEFIKPKQNPPFVDELPAFSQDARPNSLAQEEDGQLASSGKKKKKESPHIHLHAHSSESETSNESPEPDLPNQDENPKEKRNDDDCDFLKFVRKKRIVWKCRQSSEGITTCRVKCRRPFQLATPMEYVCTRDEGWTPKATPTCILPEAM
ncbi:unnamed protein product [Larinioides sclopetarius]|uniref:Sushi domain-containing protein n=1 Tax=Larinioides sclopetarius TaxID=280406 RepID=A0AAV1Z0J8_9ARAC